MCPSCRVSAAQGSIRAQLSSLILHSACVRAGLGSLGFLNPRLYAINAAHPGEAFFDVTQGNSKTSCATGFPATKGWDPTTVSEQPTLALLLLLIACVGLLRALSRVAV